MTLAWWEVLVAAATPVGAALVLAWVHERAR